MNLSFEKQLKNLCKGSKTFLVSKFQRLKLM